MSFRRRVCLECADGDEKRLRSLDDLLELPNVPVDNEKVLAPLGLFYRRNKREKIGRGIGLG